MRDFLKILFSLALIAVIIIYCAAIFESYLTSKRIEITVTQLERSQDEQGTIHYYIHTKDETFRNEDTYYQGKSNQEALMKILEKGKTYKVLVVGYNLGFDIPFFISKYRNIIKIIE